MAALKVDAFAGRFRSDEHLNRSVFKLLLRVKPAVRFFARAGFHAAVNEADAEAPVLKTPDEIVECVFKLGENQQPLVRVVKESLLDGEDL